MPQNCTTNPTTHCIDCPDIAAVPGVPEHIERSPVAAWDAGANSIDVLDGDVRVVFDTGAQTGGIVLGLKASRERPWAPELIEHGLFLRSQAGHAFVSVVELGVQKGSTVPREADDEFEIRRIAGRVTYLRNGSVLYRSDTPSNGPVMVTTAAYLSGDTVN